MKIVPSKDWSSSTTYCTYCESDPCRCEDINGQIDQMREEAGMPH